MYILDIHIKYFLTENKFSVYEWFNNNIDMVNIILLYNTLLAGIIYIYIFYLEYSFYIVDDL